MVQCLVIGFMHTQKKIMFVRRVTLMVVNLWWVFGYLFKILKGGEKKKRKGGLSSDKIIMGRT